MNTSPPQSSNLTLFDAVKQGERNRVPLIEALRNTGINRGNISDFIAAMNDIKVLLAADLIAQAWSDLDVECRHRVIREWLERKDKEQQAGGYHTLSARLLAIDPDSSMAFLDHVAKLAAGSSVCMKRVFSATRSEWVGTTLEQARFRRLDPTLLTTTSRVALLDWLCDSCAAEISASDNERRKADLFKQSQIRASLVRDWLEQLQADQLQESIASAVRRNISKMHPKSLASPSPTPVAADADKWLSEQAPVDSAPTVTPKKVTSPQNSEEPNGMLRDVFDSIKKLFQKASDQHDTALQLITSELAKTKSALERSEREVAAYGNASTNALAKLSELEGRIRVLQAAQTQADTQLSVANARILSISAELETERREKKAIRDEGHEAVARETQRERERLLVQLGQRIGNIIESYREVRSRGPLPEGLPAMVGDMMDELLARLEAAGLRFKRE